MWGILPSYKPLSGTIRVRNANFGKHQSSGMIEGVAQVNITGTPWCMPPCLLKKVQMCGTPMLVGMTRGFIISSILRQPHGG